MSKYLTESATALNIYFTPKSIIEIVEKENIKSLIQNPPYAPAKSNK